MYKARKQLTAIDWNSHFNLEDATTKAQDLIVTRKYNQHTKKKKYKCIPMLMAKIIHVRKEDVDVVTRQVSLSESDPALLAPTIAERPGPPSKELFISRNSRSKPSHLEEQSPTSAMSADNNST